MHHVVRWKQRSRSVVVPPDEPGGARGQQEGTKAQGARKLWELGDLTRLFLLFLSCGECLESVLPSIVIGAAAVLNPSRA